MARMNASTTLEALEPGDHVCTIHDSPAEMAGILARYAALGLSRGGRVGLALTSAGQRELLPVLKALGVDGAAALARGQLFFADPDALYHDRGHFQSDRVLDTLLAEEKRALADGYTGLWAAGGGPSSPYDPASSRTIIEYEARLDGLLRGRAITVLCLYDRERFDSELLLQAINLHPVILVGNELHRAGRHAASPVGDGAKWTDNELDHRLAELRHQQHQARQFKSLMENTPDIFMRFDREGRHLYVSPAIRDVVELAPEAFIGKTHRELGFAEADAAFWEKAIRYVFELGLAQEMEFDFEGRHGLRTFNWRLIPEFDDCGAVATVLSIARDVTELKKTRASYETLFNCMMDGFALHEMLFDAAGAPCDYRFLSINPAFEQLTGLCGEKVLGRTVREIFPDIEPAWIQTYGRVIRSGRNERFEKYFPTLGKWFEVLAFPAGPGRFGAIFRDITTQKQALGALEEAEQRYRTIFETSPNGIILVDPQAGRLIDFNTAAHTLLGYTREEFASLGYAEMDATGDPAVHQRHLQEIRANGSAIFEASMRAKGGEARELLINVNQILLGGRQVHYTIFQDITERKRLQERLR